MESNQTEQPQELGDQSVGHKTILKTEALYQYILETSVYPRELQYMKNLRELTAKHPKHRMMTCDDQLQFLSMLLKPINAKKTMEIGVFTGYSLLATALALPEDEKEDYLVGLLVIEKAGVAHKIEFKESLAMPVLDQMIQDGTYHGTFDFAYVDADKANYICYHERLLDLVKVGGLIVYDNILWSGSVAMPPDAPMSDHLRKRRSATLEVNKALAADPRVEVSLLFIGDGVTLCRRIS